MMLTSSPSVATHKRLRNMTAGNANSSSQDCSICLNNIAVSTTSAAPQIQQVSNDSQPCQCLFVAPCSHTWHYKCIRSLLTSGSYPIFICPNCRAAADLEAEVEDPEEWEQLDSDEGGAAGQQGALLQPPPADTNSPNNNSNNSTTPSAPRRSRESVRSARFLAGQHPQSQPTDVPDVTMLLDPPPPAREDSPAQLDGAGTLADSAAAVLSHTTSNPMPIPSATQRILPDGRRETRTPSPTGAPVTNGPEGPITPRNDAGPWVFDGSGVRLSQEGGRPVLAGGATGQSGSGTASRVVSLEAAVQAAGNRISREDGLS